MPYVLHNLNGTEPQKTVINWLNDEKQEQKEKPEMALLKAQAGSCFTLFSRDGQNITAEAKKPKSDDKIVIGYTAAGLPFQIIVDGFKGGETQQTHEFIDNVITPLINNWSDKFTKSDEIEVDIRQMIFKIYQLRARFAANAEFTMSIAISYEKQNQLYCAAFGIGDTAIVRYADDDCEQLIPSTTVNKFKDAFDSAIYRAITDRPELFEELVSRNKISHTPVSPGDEIAGYTFLFREAQKEARTFDRPNILKGRKEDHIIQYEVDTSNFLPKRTLFENLTLLNRAIHKQRLADKKSGGDDASFGSMIIPEYSLRCQIVEQQYKDFKAAILNVLEDPAHRDNLQISNLMPIYLKITSLMDHDAKAEHKILYNEILSQTYYLLLTPKKYRAYQVELYELLARQLEKSSSPSLQGIGIAMMLLGAALAVAAPLVLLCTVPLSTTLSIGLAVSGSVLAISGGGFFSYGSKPRGLSQAVYKFSNDVLNLDSDLGPIASQEEKPVAPTII